MRRYSVSFEGVAVTAVQDLFELTCGANKTIEIVECHITQSSDAGDAEAEMLRVSCDVVSGAFTSGSGGSSVTPAQLDKSGTASGATAEANNTTQNTGGTANTVHAEGCHVAAGFRYVPTLEGRPVLGGGDAFVVRLDGAPADSLTMSGTLTYIERG